MSDIQISPFYNSAVNAVTKPNKLTHVSQYFIDRWMPLLGGNGTMIVLALRRGGFLDRRTGEMRDEIVISRAELAAAAGMSEDTLTRELGINKKTGQPQNEWLHYFVQKRNRKRRDRLGQVRQDESAYWVSMDDPVHPEDWVLVEQYVQEAEERLEKQPGTHFAFLVRKVKTQPAETEPQSAFDAPQSAEFKTQPASHLNTLDSSILKNTFQDALSRPEISNSSFPEKEKKPCISFLAWEFIGETEQARWRLKAYHLIVKNGWKKPGDIAVNEKAAELYDAALGVWYE